MARVHPADVVVGRIADDLGLLVHAAAGELGSIRAGALAFVLDAVRSSGLEGDTSLTGALEALAAALAEEEAEAPLEPRSARGDPPHEPPQGEGTRSAGRRASRPVRKQAIRDHASLVDGLPRGAHVAGLWSSRRDRFKSIKTIARPGGMVRQAGTGRRV